MGKFNILTMLGFRRDKGTSSKPKVELSNLVDTFNLLHDNSDTLWNCTLKYEEGTIFTFAASKLAEDIVKKELENSRQLRNWHSALDTLMLSNDNIAPGRGIMSPVGMVVKRGSVEVSTF